MTFDSTSNWNKKNLKLSQMFEIIFFNNQRLGDLFSISKLRIILVYNNYLIVDKLKSFIWQYVAEELNLLELRYFLDFNKNINRFRLL